MHLFDNITEYLSSFPTMSCIKQWFDGDVSFKFGNFLGSIKLNVAKAEICATVELKDENFKDYGVNLSEVALLFLVNELSANIENVSFFVIPDAGLCMCLKKFFYYSSQDDAQKFLQSAISELSIVAEATLRIAAAFEIPNIPDDFYEVIKKELGKATFDHIVQRMNDVRILLVDDFFNPGLMELKTHLKSRLQKSCIFEADRDLNPEGMNFSLIHQIQENKINWVLGYGNGCFFVNQLTNVSKIFISPKFQYSEALKKHIEEYTPDVSGMPYDIETARRFAVMSAEKIEDNQFFNIRHEDIDNTVAFFWIDNCSDKNAQLYNMAYGPISELLSDPEVFTDDIVRFNIVPAINALYVKTHRPVYKGDVSRGEFAEHLRSVVQDKIAYGAPEVFGERAFVKVCPYTHDISLEHGYQERILVTMDKEEQIVTNEDQIRFLTLQRYPDDRIKDFIDGILKVTEPYMLNRSYKLGEILLVVHKDDLSMEIKIKDKNNPISKNNTEDIYLLSSFFKRYKRSSNYSIDMVRLTSVALKYISVEGLS